MCGYKTLTLLAKEGTPYTKLAIKITGEGVGNNEAFLTCEVKINNTVLSNKYIELTDEEQTVEINLYKYAAKQPFGAYRGNVIPDIKNNIFENSSVNDYDDGNCIKITFTNDSGVKFTVEFDGYYDKIGI